MVSHKNFSFSNFILKEGSETHPITNHSIKKINAAFEILAFIIKIVLLIILLTLREIKGRKL